MDVTRKMPTVNGSRNEVLDCNNYLSLKNCSELHAKLDLIKLIEDELTKSTAVKDVKKWVSQTKNQTRSKLKELKKAK